MDIEPKYKEATTVASYELDSSSEEDDDDSCIAWRIPRRIMALEKKSRAPKMSREARSPARSHKFFEPHRSGSNGVQSSSQQPHPPQPHSSGNMPHSLQPHSTRNMPISNPSAAAVVNFDWTQTQIPVNLAHAQPQYMPMPQFTQMPLQHPGYFSQHTVYAPNPFNISHNPETGFHVNDQPQMQSDQYLGHPLTASTVLPNIHNQQTNMPQLSSTAAFPPDFSRTPPSLPQQQHHLSGNLQQQQQQNHQQNSTTLPQRGIIDTRYRYEYGGVVSSATGVSPSQDVRLNAQRNLATHRMPHQGRNFTRSHYPRRFEPQTSTARTYPEHKEQKKRMERKESTDTHAKKLRLNDVSKGSSLPNAQLNKPQSSDMDQSINPSEDLPRVLDVTLASMSEGEANQTGQPSLNQYIEPPELESTTSEEAAMPHASPSSEMPTYPPKPQTQTTSKTPSSRESPSLAVDTPTVIETQDEPQPPVAVTEIISNGSLAQPHAPTPTAVPAQDLIPPEHIKKEKIAEPEETNMTSYNGHSVIDSVIIKTEFKKEKELRDCETDSNHESNEDTESDSEDEHCGPSKKAVETSDEHPMEQASEHDIEQAGEHAIETAGEEDSEEELIVIPYLPKENTEPPSSQ